MRWVQKREVIFGFVSVTLAQAIYARAGTVKAADKPSANVGTLRSGSAISLIPPVSRLG
jgi:hypothetical protein